MFLPSRGLKVDSGSGVVGSGSSSMLIGDGSSSYLQKSSSGAKTSSSEVQ